MSITATRSAIAILRISRRGPQSNPGRNFVKSMVEWNLPPCGSSTSALRVSTPRGCGRRCSSPVWSTNVDGLTCAAGADPAPSSISGFRCVNVLDMTLSVGGAMAFEAAAPRVRR